MEDLFSTKLMKNHQMCWYASPYARIDILTRDLFDEIEVPGMGLNI